MSQTVLFLQGPPSGFWVELGDAFVAAGHSTRRIHLTVADQLWWRRPGADAYRGRLAGWAEWLGAYVARHGVTDILYFADRAPYHRVAAAVARARGLRAWAVEFGYLRPDWLTLEPFGMGAASCFTRDPAQIRALAAGRAVPDLATRYPHTFAREAVGEVSYNLIQSFGRPFYPRYVADKYYPVVLDYLSWLPRLARQGAAARAAAQVEAAATGWSYVLLALQLQSDYQIRASSPYGHLREMLGEVVASFAAHAPGGMRLVVKQHPLDNGWERWGRVLARLAAQAGVADRVVCIDGGNLAALIDGSAGVVTVNSTVGLHAIHRGRPVKVLGNAVYDIPGLTHQGDLDGFWRAPQPVDPGLALAYRAALAAEIQVRGSFYHPAGRRAAQAEIVARIGDPARYWRLWRDPDLA